MLKYYVNGNEVSKSQFYDTLNDKITDYVNANLDDIIDSNEDKVRIGCLEYYPFTVLKEIDPIAYNCYAKDEVNFQYEEDQAMFEHGDKMFIYDTDFETYDPEATTEDAN